MVTNDIRKTLESSQNPFAMGIAGTGRSYILQLMSKKDKKYGNK